MTTTTTMKVDEIITKLRNVGMEPRERASHKLLKRASVLIPILLLHPDGEDDDNSDDVDSGGAIGGNDSKNGHDATMIEQEEQEDHDDVVIPHVILTRRSMKLRSHPGHSAYPGGKQDEEDNNDDVVTALRETHEEVGIPPNYVTPLCRQPTLESMNHLCVTPIIGIVNFSSDNDTNDTLEQPSSQKQQHDTFSGSNKEDEDVGDNDNTDHNNRKRKSYSSRRRIRKTLDQQKQDILSKLVINHDEVDNVFIIPLSFFLQEPKYMEDVEWQGETFTYREYIYEYLNGKTKMTGENGEDDDSPTTAKASSKDDGAKFKITGLTANMSYDAAKIVYSEPLALSEQQKVAISTPPTTTMRTTTTSNLMNGYLWRLEESKSLSTRSNRNNKGYWKKGYFVVTEVTQPPQQQQQQQQQQEEQQPQNNSTRSSRMLHRYDSMEQATAKTNSANKKHRLPLHENDFQVQKIISSASQAAIDHTEKVDNNSSVYSNMNHTNEDTERGQLNGDAGILNDGDIKEHFEFQVSALGGRLQWHLAASNEEERTKWMEVLVTSNT